MTDSPTPEAAAAFVQVVTFQGASDDLVEIDGCPGADEFPADPEYDGGLFVLETDEHGLLVKVTYEAHGCWSVAVMPREEDEAIPAWPLAWGEPMNGYTACLAITCPPDVRLRRIEGVAFG